MKRCEIARNLFLEGYACSVSIVKAFSDIVNIDDESITKLALPFGGGIGRLRLTCGVFSGMCMIIGAIFSENSPSEDNKILVYKKIQELAKRFENKIGSLCCFDILNKHVDKVEVGGLPETRDATYYKNRPCHKVVYLGALILEEFLIEENII